ncbi:hypothetical protein D3C85_1215940 [compost metagenome]
MLRFTPDMCIHAQHVMPLDVRMVVDVQAELFIGMQLNRILIEHRKTDPAFAADYLDTVFPAIGNKIPAAHAHRSRSEPPTGADRIFGSIQTSLPRSEAGDFDDIAQQVLEEVKAMTGQIGEVTAAGNRRIGSPVARALQIRRRRRFGQGPGQVPNLADPPQLQPLPHLLEARQ